MFLVKLIPHSRRGYVRIVNTIQPGLSNYKYRSNDVENAAGCTFYDNEQLYTPSSLVL